MSSAVFPSLKGIQFPVKKTPEFSNLIQASASGMEYRAQLWIYPRWTWEVSFDWLRTDNSDLQTLMGFFLARNGSYDSFQFTDVDDDSVTGQSIGVGNGTQTAWQLVRTYSGFTEPLYAPTTVSVFLNGTPTSAYTLSSSAGSAGVITFATAPGSGVVITANITYNWPVRFVADKYDFSKFMQNLYELQKLDFISVKNYP